MQGDNAAFKIVLLKTPIKIGDICKTVVMIKENSPFNFFVPYSNTCWRLKIINKCGTVCSFSKLDMRNT